MSRILLLCLALIPTALVGPRLAAQDAKAVLHAVETNIGADSLRCITYSGAGYVGIVGQNYTPRDDWPRVELASYKKTVNFDARSAREEQVTRQGTQQQLQDVRNGQVPHPVSSSRRSG